MARSLGIVIWALLVLVSPAGAQVGDMFGDESDDVMIEAIWGVGGVTKAERYAPVRVMITSADPVGGTVSLEYEDAGREIRVSRRFGAGAGTTSIVDLAFCVPANLSEASIVLRDDRGRTIRSASFETFETRTSQPMGLSVATGYAICFVGEFRSQLRRSIGEIESPELENQWGARQAVEKTAKASWAYSVLGFTRGESLPSLAMAYDGLDTVVLDAREIAGLDDRTVTALRRWVEGGGHLAIVQQSPGVEWARFVPSPLLSISDPGEVSIDLDEASFTSMASTLGIEVPGYEAPSSSRLVSVTEAGTARGWTSDLGGVVATGPVGLGVVQVLGVDPERLSEVLDADATFVAWATVLTPCLPSGEANEHFWPWSSGGGARDQQERMALDNVFNIIGDIPSPGDGTFIVIAALCLLLAIMVGPFDMLVLKRFGWRHLSWASALVWVALASALAWLAPSMVRQGASTVHRLEVVDKVIDPAMSDADAMASPAWRTGVTGIFASSPMRYGIEPDVSGLWWRPVTVQFFGRSGARRPMLTLVQEASAPTEPVGQSPLAFGAGQWTYESVMDRGAVPAPFTARFEGDDIVLTGFGDARIRGAALERWRGTSEIHRVDFDSDGAVHRGAVTDDTKTFLSNQTMYYAQPQTGTYRLAGSLERRHAMDRMLQSGRFAILYLDVRDDGGVGIRDRAGPVDASYERWRYVRLVIPLEDA